MSHETAQMEAFKGLLGIILVYLYPAVCIGAIAARQGRPGLRYGLLSLIPLASLILLALLAFGPQPARQRPVAA